MEHLVLGIFHADKVMWLFDTLQKTVSADSEYSPTVF